MLVTRTPLVAFVVALALSGCAGLQVGREFPSPEAAQIKNDVTDKARLLTLFGEPYQVGIDNGDQTWRWFYAQRSASATTSKDLSVRFNANGTVKSYSFTSNFPDDMKKLR
jgi:outer membrane protein assembly factor BamE (lipoprotein component of BamABCDE complex)